LHVANDVLSLLISAAFDDIVQQPQQTAYSNLHVFFNFSFHWQSKITCILYSVYLPVLYFTVVVLLVSSVLSVISEVYILVNGIF